MIIKGRVNLVVVLQVVVMVLHPVVMAVLQARTVKRIAALSQQSSIKFIAINGSLVLKYDLIYKEAYSYNVVKHIMK